MCRWKQSPCRPAPRPGARDRVAGGDEARLHHHARVDRRGVVDEGGPARHLVAGGIAHRGLHVQRLWHRRQVGRQRQAQARRARVAQRGPPGTQHAAVGQFEIRIVEGVALEAARREVEALADHVPGEGGTGQRRAEEVLAADAGFQRLAREEAAAGIRARWFGRPPPGRRPIGCPGCRWSAARYLGGCRLARCAPRPRSSSGPAPPCGWSRCRARSHRLHPAPRRAAGTRGPGGRAPASRRCPRRRPASRRPSCAAPARPHGRFPRAGRCPGRRTGRRARRQAPSRRRRGCRTATGRSASRP